MEIRRAFKWIFKWGYRLYKALTALAVINWLRKGIGWRGEFDSWIDAITGRGPVKNFLFSQDGHLVFIVVALILISIREKTLRKISNFIHSLRSEENSPDNLSSLKEMEDKWKELKSQFEELPPDLSVSWWPGTIQFSPNAKIQNVSSICEMAGSLVKRHFYNDGRRDSLRTWLTVLNNRVVTDGENTDERGTIHNLGPHSASACAYFLARLFDEHNKAKTDPRPQGTPIIPPLSMKALLAASSYAEAELAKATVKVTVRVAAVLGHLRGANPKWGSDYESIFLLCFHTFPPPHWFTDFMIERALYPDDAIEKLGGDWKESVKLERYDLTRGQAALLQFQAANLVVRTKYNGSDYVPDRNGGILFWNESLAREVADHLAVNFSSFFSSSAPVPTSAKELARTNAVNFERHEWIPLAELFEAMDREVFARYVQNVGWRVAGHQADEQGFKRNCGNAGALLLKHQSAGALPSRVKENHSNPMWAWLEYLTYHPDRLVATAVHIMKDARGVVIGVDIDNLATNSARVCRLLEESWPNL